MTAIASPSQPPSPSPSSDQRHAVAAEYFGKLVERHQLGASESDIRMAFRDFIVQTDIVADESEIKSEVPPGADSANRVDLYARNTYIEFKRNLIIGGDIAPDYIAQLDGYLLDAAKSGSPHHPPPATRLTPRRDATTLDRVHAAMLFQDTGRSQACGIDRIGAGARSRLSAAGQRAVGTVSVPQRGKAVAGCDAAGSGAVGGTGDGVVCRGGNGGRR